MLGANREDWLMLSAAGKPGNILGTWTSAIIDHDVRGDNELIAAVADRRIYVVGITCISSGNVNVTLESDGTDLTGPLPFHRSDQLVWPIAARGWYVCTGNGGGLNMRLSSAMLISGVVTYYVA